MAGTAPGPGQTPLNQGQQNALASALSNVSPPNNPKTPFQRTDPQTTWLERLNVPRVGFQDLNELLDDKDDVTVAIVTSMQTAVTQMLKMMPAKDVAFRLAASLLQSVSPQLSQLVNQQWVESNQPPTVPGAPIVTGSTGGTPTPGINPGVLAAMAGNTNGAAPGSPPLG